MGYEFYVKETIQMSLLDCGCRNRLFSIISNIIYTLLTCIGHQTTTVLLHILPFCSLSNLYLLQVSLLN